MEVVQRSEKKIKTLSTSWEIVFLTLWGHVQIEVEITEILVWRLSFGFVY